VSIYSSIASRLITRSLTKNFEQVIWLGSPLEIADDQSLVVYSNHNSYYDGYLAWWFFSQYLDRPYKVWMEDFDRFPQFGPLGALPFPKDNPKTRMSTIKKSAKLLESQKGQVVHFMPEGKLTRPEKGVGPFQADLGRFDKVLCNKLWLPFVIHISWNGGPNPIAYMACGDVHDLATGNEMEKLKTLLQESKESLDGESFQLLKGKIPTQDRWDFSFSKPLFKS